MQHINIFTKTRWLVTIILLTFLSVGNVWGITVSDLSISAATTLTNGDSYVVANAYNGTYLTASGSGWGGTTTTVSSAAVFTAHGSASGFYLTCSGGTLKALTSKSFSYDSGTTNNLSLSASGEIQNSSNTSWKLRFVSGSGYRWYSSSTGVAVYLFKINASGPSLSVSNNATSLEVGDAKVNGSGVSNNTLSFSGSNLSANVSLSISGTNASMFSVLPTSVNKGNGTISDQTITVTYNPTSAGSHEATLTISSGTASKTITLTGTGKYEVTWKCNGSDDVTTLVASGSRPTFPSTPTSCDTGEGASTTFVGWTKTTWSGKKSKSYIDGLTTDATRVHTSNSTMPTISANGTIYHAVFCNGGGGSVTLTGSDFHDRLESSYGEKTITKTIDETNYTFNLNACEPNNTGNKCQMRDNTTLSYIQIPTLPGVITRFTSTSFTNASDENYTGVFHFKSAKTRGNANTNDIAKLDCTSSGISSLDWDLSSVNSSATSGYLLTSAGLRMTDLTIYYGSAGTNYMTTCCTPLGSINGSVSLTQLDTPDPTKLQATWTMNATTGISSYTLEVYNGNSLVKTINNYTSGTEITELTPCTSYTAKLYTVSSGSSYCEGGLISTSSACSTNGYALTVTKPNCSISSGSEPANICSNVSVTYTAATGYALPSSITVSNAGTQNTGWTWNSGTGVLTINKANVTGNVSVTITPTCIIPTITVDPASKTDYTVGDEPVALSVTASANNAELGYLWQVSSDNIAWSSASGTNNEQTYIPTIAEGTKYYRVIVSNSVCSCEDATSEVATITAVAPTACVEPTFSVDAGTYTTTKSVELNCLTDGAVIRYTTDGTDPIATSPMYSTPIAITKTTTIKAKAFHDTYNASGIVSATYTLQCATPTFNVPAGIYNTGAQTVAISSTDGATVYYTTDGSDPTDSETRSTYASAITVSENQTIKAFAIKDDWSNSAVGVATYTIYYPRTVLFDAGAGTATASLTESAYGEGVTLPSATPSSYCAAEGWTFAGWATSNSTTTAPTLKANDNYNCAQTTLYAVYKKTEEDTEEETASVNIGTYATANNWNNESQHASVNLNSDITATASDGSNTGKYYSSDSEWRFYQTENATITINAAESCTLKSATFTYNVKSTGELKDGTTAVASGDAYEISGTSKSFSVGNSGSATNGQVKFTAISVTYDKAISSDVYSSTPSCCDDEVTIAVESTTNGSFTVKQNTTSVVGEKLGTCTAAQTVTVTCSPDPGYHLGEVSQSLASGVTITEVSENVYTISYAKNTTGTSTISVRFDETVVPSYTLTPNSFTIGDVAKDATVERTFTVSAVHLEGEKVSLTSSNDKYSVSPNELTINNDGSVTLTDITVSLNTGATGSYSTTITLSDGASTPNTATVTLSATVKNQYSVRWFVNEEEQTESANYLDGATISSKPDDPESCDPSISFVGWTSDAAWEGKTNTKPTLKAASEITTAIADVEYRAVFAKVGQSSWREANLADLTGEDKFVIVGNNGSNYAMTNDNGTSAPTATSITIADGKLSNAPADNLKWNVSGNATDGYTFYPNGSTTTWLYCTNANNGVKVGTGDAKAFTVKSGYLYTSQTSDARYVGIYDSQDWRCYTSNGGNIEGQAFAFYKYIAPAVKDYMTTCAVTFSATYEAGSGTGDDYVVNNIAKNGSHTVLGNNVTGFTKDGYRFTGWKDGSTDRAVGYIYEDVTADLTLVAQWAEKEEAGLAYAHASYDVMKNGTFTKPTLTNPNNLTVTYNSSNESVATVDAEGNVTLITDALGETTITASSAATDDYKAGVASYTLLVVEKWAMTYTSNLDVDENDYTVIINGTTYANQSHRYGTGSVAGEATINVPKNTQKLHFHAAGWNNETVALKIEKGSTTLMTINALVREENIAGNDKTYTLTGKTSTDEYYCIDLSGYEIAANTAITFTATAGKRFLLYGVNEEGGIRELPADETNASTLPDDVNVSVGDGKTLNVNDNKTLDNLTIEAGGNLALNGDEDKKLTVNDMTINAMGGYSTTDGKSGQIIGTNVEVTGDLYLEIKLCSGDLDATKYYCISAPFDVSMSDGFYWGGTKLTLNSHFQLFEYQGKKRAETGNGWQRVSGTMKANTAYFIIFNSSNTNPNTIRLKAMNKTISNPEIIDLGESYASGIDDKHSNWHGVANPTFHYIGLNQVVQIFDYVAQGFNPYTTETSSSETENVKYGYVVGTPIFVKSNATSLAINSNGEYRRAPQRQSERYNYCVRISKEGATRFDNQLYVVAAENASASYDEGKDVLTMNGETSNYGALIWTKNYGMRLAVEEAPLVNQKASYALGIFAPAAGTYTISVAAPKENAELYLTKNGRICWNLTMGACEVELTQGQNNEYGLLLRAEAPQVTTGVENGESLNGANGVQKVIIDEHVYILRGEQLYGVDGKAVK